jgi:hypothetical protein
MVNELNKLQLKLRDLFTEYESVKTEMEEYVKKQKKWYAENSIYLALVYCGKKDCVFCPHYFEWRQTFKFKQKNSNKLYGKRLGKRITHKILRAAGKDNLYLLFKTMEEEANIIQQRRDRLANRIQKIQRIFRDYQSASEKATK